MSKMPQISGKELISALNKIGFKVIRVKGSHHFLKSKSGKTTVVPMHSNENNCEISKEELIKNLK